MDIQEAYALCIKAAFFEGFEAAADSYDNHLSKEYYWRESKAKEAYDAIMNIEAQDDGRTQEP